MVVHGRPKIPKNTSFLGSPSPHGSHNPYILGDTTRPGHVTCPSLIQIWSKTAEKNSAQRNKQTHRQTDRHYENNGHLAVNQWMNEWKSENKDALASSQCFCFHYWRIKTRIIHKLYNALTTQYSKKRFRVPGFGTGSGILEPVPTSNHYPVCCVKQVGMEKPSNIIISFHRNKFFKYYEYSTNY